MTGHRRHPLPPLHQVEGVNNSLGIGRLLSGHPASSHRSKWSESLVAEHTNPAFNPLPICTTSPRPIFSTSQPSIKAAAHAHISLPRNTRLKELEIRGLQHVQQAWPLRQQLSCPVSHSRCFITTFRDPRPRHFLLFSRKQRRIVSYMSVHVSTLGLLFY